MPDVSFSIITPCLNARAFIADAVESVLAQQGPTVEHIIVDGGSADGTLDVLKRYPHLIVISESDKGMYDAINKGIKISSGAFIGLLNADDLYPPESLRQAMSAFVQDSEILAVNSGFAVFEGGGAERKIIRISPSVSDEEFWYRIVRGSTAPNTWFLRRSIFDKYGYYDSRYRYAADRELIIRLAVAGIRPVSLPGENYWFRQHEGSATFSANDSREFKRGMLRIQILLEGQDIQERYLARQNLPRIVERELHQAHSETCYKIAATALYHRQWKLSISAIQHGLRYDILWPLVFVRMAAHRLRKEITGHD